MAEGNGSAQSGFTIKEILNEQNKKLDEIYAVVVEAKNALTKHIADGHAEKANAVHDWKQRSEGSISTLKYFFGASVGSFILTVLQIIDRANGSK